MQVSKLNDIVFLKRSKGFYNWAWDVITGCKNGCEYCYARKEIKDFEKITFHEDLLDEPHKVAPSIIFVNQLAVIMGDWIPGQWIYKIIEVMRDLPEHTFIIITKCPENYEQYDFPANCILGVTIESPDKWYRAEIMKKYRNRKMCSVEPILGDFTGKDFSQFEFVVVGCLIGTSDHSNYNTVKHTNKHYTR